MTPRDYLMALAQANLEAEVRAIAEAGYPPLMGSLKIAEFPPDAVEAILDRLRFTCDYMASNPLPDAAIMNAGGALHTEHEKAKAEGREFRLGDAFYAQFQAVMRTLAQE